MQRGGADGGKYCFSLCAFPFLHGRGTFLLKQGHQVVSCWEGRLSKNLILRFCIPVISARGCFLFGGCRQKVSISDEHGKQLKVKSSISEPMFRADRVAMPSTVCRRLNQRIGIAPESCHCHGVVRFLHLLLRRKPRFCCRGSMSALYKQKQRRKKNGAECDCIDDVLLHNGPHFP